MRPIPKAAAAFVASHEGLRLDSYLCPADVPTIGYGHTGLAVHLGMRITQEQAEKFLLDDLKTAAAKLHAVVSREVIDSLTDTQYTALLSFVFNLGAKPEWKIWAALNARQYEEVPRQMLRFVHAGGKRLQGLVNRRTDEVGLWRTAEPGTDAVDLPSSYTREEAVEPTPEPTKPIVKSRTAWTGVAVTILGAVQLAAQEAQAMIAAQVQHLPWLGKLLALTAGLTVAAGVLVIVIKKFERTEAKR